MFAALESAGCNPRRERDGGILARVPCRDDQHPSLKVSIGDDGRLLVCDRAGKSSAEENVAALGLTMADLFPESMNGHSGTNGKRSTTLAPPTASFIYHSAEGEPIGRVTRHPTPDGKTFRQWTPDSAGWKAGGFPPTLYRLPELIEADRESFIIIVEGEKHADALAAEGMIATTAPMGAGKWGKVRDLSALHGRHIVILPDNDEPGRAHAQDITLSLIGKAASVRILELPGLPPKGDVLDWLAAGGDVEELSRMAEAAPIIESAPEDDAAPPQPIPFGELRRLYPDLRRPIIDGLLRQGETANIIAPSKAGKSWLTKGLALSIVKGDSWLGQFECAPGKVLIIDNELHPTTIAYRLPKVAERLGIEPHEYDGKVDVLSLRGRGVTIPTLRPIVNRIEPGEYVAIFLDAWYRFIPSGMNENSNADVQALYNLLDEYADMTAAAWIVVHHSSKGLQGEKSVTDTGAGAGAQSRAADSHIVLRPHEEEGHVVLEAAVRSFAPVDPIGLRWDFPVWERAYALDTSALKGRKSKAEERQDEKDAEGRQAIRDALSAGPATPRHIRTATGFGAGRADRLLDIMAADGEVLFDTIKIRGNDAREYRLSQP